MIGQARLRKSITSFRLEKTSLAASKLQAVKYCPLSLSPRKELYLREQIISNAPVSRIPTTHKSCPKCPKSVPLTPNRRPRKIKAPMVASRKIDNHNRP